MLAQHAQISGSEPQHHKKLINLETPAVQIPAVIQHCEGSWENTTEYSPLLGEKKHTGWVQVESGRKEIRSLSSLVLKWGPSQVVVS